MPATIGVLDGRIRVGLTEDELGRFTADARKVGPRDLAAAVVQGAVGATTVGGTLAACRSAGIGFMGTGGLGGVHRGFPDPPDVSADLGELIRTEALIVSSGVKSILDVPATAELLETLGVPVLGYRTDDLPLFYAAHGGPPVSARVESAEEAAEIARAHWRLGRHTSILLGRPAEDSLDDVEPLIERALADAHASGVSGQAVTPFVLSYLHRESRRAHARGEPRADRRERGPGRGGGRRLCLSMTQSRISRSRSSGSSSSRTSCRSKHITRRTTVVPPARRRRGGRRRGRHLRGGAPPATSRLPDLPAGTRSTRSPSSSPARAGLPRLGARVGGARPRPAPGRPLARRRGRARAAAGHLRRLPEQPARVARARAGAALQARRERLRGRTRSSRSSPRPARSTSSTSRACTTATGSTRPRPPSSTAASPTAFPQRLARGRRARRGDAPRARAAPRPADLGLPDPLRRRRRGARVAAAVPQLEAVALRQRAAAVRLLRPLRRERDRGLRRRPVRARPRPRADPAPGVALPPGRAERRRAEGVQRGRPAAGPADEPARRPPRREPGFR